MSKTQKDESMRLKISYLVHGMKNMLPRILTLSFNLKFKAYNAMANQGFFTSLPVCISAERRHW
jgi:hypothetical protein